MKRNINLNFSEELIKEIRSRKPEIQQMIANSVNNDLNKNKDKYFNEITGELKGETKLTNKTASIDIETSAIGFAYDSGEWDNPEVTAEVRERKTAGYYRDYAMRRRMGLLKSGRVHGKKRIPFIENAVQTGVKKFKKEFYYAG